MPADAAFIDTNILVYLITDDEKADRAEAIVSAGGHVSVQVLAELTNVMLRKMKASWPEIIMVANAVRAKCIVHDLTLAVHDRATELARSHGLTIYDGQIVAAALAAGAKTLWSEDMQHGRMFEGQLRILNPFVPVVN